MFLFSVHALCENVTGIIFVAGRGAKLKRAGRLRMALAGMVLAETIPPRAIHCQGMVD
jgi:hypothetical protein